MSIADTSDNRARGGPTLTGSTARGFGWLAAQTLAGRVLSLASYLGLTWLIEPGAFGLMGLAQTAMSFVMIVQQLGIRELLIQRSGSVRTWVTPAWWLSWGIGIGASVLLALASPLVEWFYAEPGLAGVVLVLALSPIPKALRNVPEAVLRTQMRFRAVAFIEFVGMLVIAVLSVALAALDFGAYALAIPVPVAALIQLVMTYRLARLRPRRLRRLGHMRYLVTNGALLLGSRVMTTVVQQGDYIALGLFHTKEVVGVYFFAFNMSIQTVRLLTYNLSGVLLPALSTIKGDPPRARSAYLRAVGALGLVGTPIALAQAAFADPLVMTVIQKDMHGTVPLLQILSIAMLFQMLAGTSASMLNSQRRYMTRLVLNTAMAVTLFGFALLAAWLGAAREVALAVLAYHLILAPVRVYIALRAVGGTVRDALELFIRPIAAGLLASGAGMFAGLLADPAPGLLADPDPVGTWVSSIVTTGVGGLVYLALAPLLMRRPFREVMDHARGALRTVRRRSLYSAPPDDET